MTIVFDMKPGRHMKKASHTLEISRDRVRFASCTATETIPMDSIFKIYFQINSLVTRYYQYDKLKRPRIGPRIQYASQPAPVN